MGSTACTGPQCLYKGDLYLYINVGRGLWRACTDERTYLIFFEKTGNNSVWGIFLENALEVRSDFWSLLYLCAIIPSHFTTILLFISQQLNSCLWNVRHIAMNCFPLHLREGYLESRSHFSNPVGTSACNRTHVGTYRPMKNK